MTTQAIQTEPKLVRFSLRLQQDFLEVIAEQASESGRSVNDLLNEVVAEYLDAGRCPNCGKPWK